jgi:hypothetical protein
VRQSPKGDQVEELPLSKAAEYLLDECRMVLPGIQALFGFQLIAVFNPSFEQKLSVPGQRLHVLALALVAIAVAIVMTPAAYHRQTGPRVITETFLTVSTRLLLWSMLPLGAGIIIDFALIVDMIFDGLIVVSAACGVFALFFVLWFVLPRMAALQRALSGDALSASRG